MYITSSQISQTYKLLLNHFTWCNSSLFLRRSLIEFFNKMKKWQDMANLPQDFRQGTEKLERNFTVSAVIFKKYVPIFKAIFKAPSEEPPRVHRSRKQRYESVCDRDFDFHSKLVRKKKHCAVFYKDLFCCS